MSDKPKGPTRDARGRVSGGNPGNSGGKKGRSGRKPGPFKAMLAEIRDSAEFADALERAALDPNGRNFGAAVKVITDYDESKPAKKAELSGGFVATIRIVREGRRTTAS